ncbi:MAG TPA: RNA-binding cell elongation regulator Jag/EloR [Candidatus Limnocylindrales bacterium]|nr:RNA-binding cell elongation regulator Jag/EloR [Candidatus Limnocylindrales bacterium]
MATTIEAQGHTVDEAIQIALNQLGVSRDKVEIDILHHPRRGLLGIGARRAKVRATIRESVMLDGEEFDMSGGDDSLDDKPRRRRRRGGRNRTGREGAEPRAEKVPARAAMPAREAPRADNDRRSDARPAGEEGARNRGDAGRGDRRGGRNRGDQRGERGTGQPRNEAQPRGGQERRDPPRERSSQRGGQQQQNERRDRDAGGNRGRSEAPQKSEGAPRGVESAPHERGQMDRPERGQMDRPERGQMERAERGQTERGQSTRATEEGRARRQPPENVQPLDAASLDAIRLRAEELVRELLVKMGFAAEVTSTSDLAAGEAIVCVRSDNEGLLIGRRGQTLDSLEHIVNRMALRGEAYVEGRVLLDIGDYRRRRRESLEELATRLRTRAVGERRSVQVSPMSPRDRRYFMQAFADDEAVEVRALGAGFYRRVIVAPAGAATGPVVEANADVEDEDLISGFAEAEH